MNVICMDMVTFHHRKAENHLTLKTKIKVILKIRTKVNIDQFIEQNILAGIVSKFLLFRV